MVSKAAEKKERAPSVNCRLKDTEASFLSKCKRLGLEQGQDPVQSSPKMADTNLYTIIFYATAVKHP